MGKGNLHKWSRDIFRELEALEMRDAERDCCQYWMGVRSRIREIESCRPVKGPAGDIRFCPTCGRELK